MPITLITKPPIGTTTKKSLIDAVIDDVTSLGASGNTIYNLSGGNPNLVNGSFELDTDGNGVPDNWAVTLLPSGTSAIDSTDFAHGAYSYKFVCPGGGGSIGGGHIDSTDFIPISNDADYSFRFLVKSSSGSASNSVDIYWFKNDQTASSTPSSNIWTGAPTSWTYEVATFSPPSDAAFCKIRLTGGVAGSVAATIHFDGVEFFKAPNNVFTTASRPITTAMKRYSTAYIDIYSGVTTTTNAITLPKLGPYGGFVVLILPITVPSGAVTTFDAASGDTLNPGTITLTSDGANIKKAIVYGFGSTWYQLL